MKNLRFTKLDDQCYLIFFTGKRFNAWLRYSKASKQFNVDFLDHYFEAKTRTEAKEKIYSILQDWKNKSYKNYFQL